jgi:hypothetical protein
MQHSHAIAEAAKQVTSHSYSPVLEHIGKFFSSIGHYAGFIIPVLVFLLLLYLWTRYGRDKKLGPVPVEFDPPPDMIPFEAILIEKQCRVPLLTGPLQISRITASTLLDLYYKGAIDFETEKSGPKVRIKKIMLKELEKGLNRFEKNFLVELFDGYDLEIDLTKFKKRAFLRRLRPLIIDESKAYSPRIFTEPSGKITKVLDIISKFWDVASEFITMFFTSQILWMMLLWVIPFCAVMGIHFLLDILQKHHWLTKAASEGIFTLTTLVIVFGSFGMMIFLAVTKSKGPVSQFFYKVYDRIIHVITYASAFVFRTIWILVLFVISMSIFKNRADTVIGIFISIFLVQIFAYWMPQWNPSARTTLLHLKGFKEFIKTADADRIKRLSVENPSAFKTTLAFAIAQGHGGRWVKLLQQAGTYDGIFAILFFASNFIERIEDSVHELAGEYLEGDKKKVS